MFGNLFKRKAKTPEQPDRFLVAQLNCRIQPLHRGEFFEDPLDEKLRNELLGEVSGGGTMQHPSGEIEYCDIEIKANPAATDAPGRIVEILQELGAPKGSRLHAEDTGTEIDFGRAEGLAIYLNGTDLPDDVYGSCDSNVVYSELERLIAPGGRVLSYWQGPTETAFYLYGDSFAAMRASIADFVSSYPLCQKARIEQIA